MPTAQRSSLPDPCAPLPCCIFSSCAPVRTTLHPFSCLAASHAEGQPLPSVVHSPAPGRPCSVDGHTRERTERFSLLCFTRLRQFPSQLCLTPGVPRPHPIVVLARDIPTSPPHPQPSARGPPAPAPTARPGDLSKARSLSKPSLLQEVKPSAASAALGRHAVPIPRHACALFNRSGFDCSKYRALPPPGVTPSACHLLRCTLGLWGPEDERLARGQQEVVEPGFEPQTP